MLLNDTFRIALRGITTNKSRAMLTMLGIIIGVGSVVLMTSIGASVEGLILGQVSSLGAKSMVIFPGRDDGTPNSAGFDNFTFDDVRAMEDLTTIENVAPVIFANGTVSYGREEDKPMVLGTTPEFFLNQSISIDYGRLIDENDDQGAKFVANLGPDTVVELFGDQDPIGKRIKVLDRTFTVVGVMKPLGTQFFQNADNRVYIPFSVSRVITGQPYVNYATMTATTDLDIALDDVISLMRQRHRIKNPENDEAKDDFTVRTAAQANDILGSVSLGLTLFMSSIASISLLVGGIGIMNIMLVAVSERTREIGLRKAVGARRKDILLQFLFEAVLLTLIGGLIGVVTSMLLALIISQIVVQFLAGYSFALSIPSVLLAVAVAAGTGLVFGIYPARRAANLNPIEALRYE